MYIYPYINLFIYLYLFIYICIYVYLYIEMVKTHRCTDGEYVTLQEPRETKTAPKNSLAQEYSEISSACTALRAF